MILDSEEQRKLLLNCINSAQMTGMVAQLMAELTTIAKLIDAVQKADIKAEVKEDGD
jgi:hypothetical protein